MSRFGIAGWLAAFALALAAQGAGGTELSLRSKSLAAAASIPAQAAEAPFRVSRDPLPALFFPEPLAATGGPRGACERHAATLCYDAADGRVVYRPARRYMPRIDGLRAESISLRRDRIVFKYSFR